MAKPSWKSPNKKDVFLTDRPTLNELKVDESYTVYQSYGGGRLFWCGWKNYARLWCALRYGMNRGYNKTNVAYVKNNQTNEIVWRSWVDENPYRDRG